MEGGHTIIAHCGAAMYTNQEKKLFLQGVIKSVKKGLKAMNEQGSAVDGVVAAVKSMENNPLYNAGNGSCLNEEGEFELDAMVVDGYNFKYGAVASVKIVKNPVLLALKVMNSTPHCLVVGEGAHRLARTFQIPLLEDPTMSAIEAHRRIFEKTPYFQDWDTNKMQSGDYFFPWGRKDGSYNHDTVGCVALDSKGRIACATSTGGINGKRPGRVGDSSIIGCGGYANEEGAAAATGHGEAFLKLLACYQVVDYIEQGDHPSTAAEKVLTSIHKIGSLGGFISINKRGQLGHCFTTEHMPWAAITADGELITCADVPGIRLH